MKYEKDIKRRVPNRGIGVMEEGYDQGVEILP